MQEMPYPQFARILSRYLHERDRSGSWLARRLGVSPATVNRWLSGERRPNSPERVIEIAKALNINELQVQNDLLMAAGYGYAHPEQELTQASAFEQKASPPTEQDSLLPDEWESTQPDAEVLSRSAPRARRWIATARQRIKQAFLPKPDIPRILPDNCGSAPLSLREQMLTLSTAFGMYFVGLLERENSFVPIQDQVRIADDRVDHPNSYEAILQRLLQDDIRITVLASEGGMGKSTIAAQIIRCLFELEAVDVIIGDSAKSQMFDVDHAELWPQSILAMLMPSIFSIDSGNN